MNVIISPIIKKSTERIDTNGNIIDPNTKQILRPNLPDYVPTPEEVGMVTEKTHTDTPAPSSMSEKINAMVEAKLANKIDEIVDKKVAEILSKI